MVSGNGAKASRLSSVVSSRPLSGSTNCSTRGSKPSPDTEYPSRDLAGYYLVIPLQRADVAAGAPGVSVICLFTSYGHSAKRGKKPRRDGAEKILVLTAKALREFRGVLEDRSAKSKSDDEKDDKEDEYSKGRVVVYSPMFNSGAFMVPWRRTEALIINIFEGWTGKWIVLTPP
ncbi:hypothetical protein HD806DRAFT_22561 [Xylariaceae sp. AK1471]|nr:hypothetical protein HD806DRAFT_22561 [Xylariaceae sp. AK1471]